MPAGSTTQLQSWIELIRAGDTQAREQIIEHSCERLRRLTRKMLRQFARLRRWEETDDVLQHALIRLHRSLSEVQLESVRQFLGLAALQIRRTLIDLSRQHFGEHRQGANHHTDGHGAAADDQGGPLHQAIKPDSVEDWSSFHEAIELLPDEEREVFSLLWYEGLEQAEAATLLDTSVRTIKRRWQSARCLLFEALDGQKPDG